MIVKKSGKKPALSADGAGPFFAMNRMNCMCRSPFSTMNRIGFFQIIFPIAGAYQQIAERYRISCKQVLYTKKSKMEAHL